MKTPRAGSLRIVKGDRVRVIRGNYRDMEGTVSAVLPEKGRVVVEGVNMRKRHQRPTEAVLRTPAAPAGTFARRDQRRPSRRALPAAGQRGPLDAAAPRFPSTVGNHPDFRPSVLPHLGTGQTPSLC